MTADTGSISETVTEKSLQLDQIVTYHRQLERFSLIVPPRRSIALYVVPDQLAQR